MQVVLGWSTLHYACVYRHREIVQYLLSLGLDPMTIDKVCYCEVSNMCFTIYLYLAVYSEDQYKYVCNIIETHRK